MGHPLLSMNPLLFAMSTLWTREHNRVCDILIEKWPLWTDNEIHQTAKRIIVGEMMTIMTNEILNVYAGHSFSLKYKPKIIADETFRTYNSTTPYELLMISMWPSSLPDRLKDTSMESMLFSNNRYVIHYQWRIYGDGRI